MNINNNGSNEAMAFERCQESADFIRSRTTKRPTIGVICGSGLAGLGDLLTDLEEIPYKEIPHFPVSTAPGHNSRLLFGVLGRTTPLLLMQGRFHLYEGYTIDQCSMPVRVMKLLGIERLIVTNAAGGLNPDYKVGDIMIIEDHVNILGFVGVTPLAGPEDLRFGPRFFPMNNAYDIDWRRKAKKIADELGFSKQTREGVYIMLGGPNFETPAELRFLKTLGIDAVGMSTVHETLVARHSGIKVFGLSLITNECVVNDQIDGGATVEEVFESANKAEERLKKFVSKVILDVIARDELEA